jgi:hypothetical protein
VQKRSYSVFCSPVDKGGKISIKMRRIKKANDIRPVRQSLMQEDGEIRATAPENMRFFINLNGILQ